MRITASVPQVEMWLQRVLLAIITASVLQVEMWLQRVLLSMRETVRANLQEAVAAYADLPRDKWATQYPAQVRVGRPRSTRHTSEWATQCQYFFCNEIC